MALEQKLNLRLSQRLVMTPSLQQAIKLLQMSNVELTTFIEQEIEQNPLLERDESDPDNREAAASEGEAAPEEPAAPPSETAALGTTEPSIGEDVEAWRDAAGSEGQGDLLKRQREALGHLVTVRAHDLFLRLHGGLLAEKRESETPVVCY